MIAPTRILLLSAGRDNPLVRHRARGFVLRRSMRGALGMAALIAGVAFVVAFGLSPRESSFFTWAAFIVLVMTIAQLAPNEADCWLLAAFARGASMARAHVLRTWCPRERTSWRAQAS